MSFDEIPFEMQQALQHEKVATDAGLIEGWTVTNSQLSLLRDGTNLYKLALFNETTQETKYVGVQLR